MSERREIQVGDLVRLDSTKDKALMGYDDNGKPILLGYTYRHSPYHEFILIRGVGEIPIYQDLVVEVVKSYV